MLQGARGQLYDLQIHVKTTAAPFAKDLREIEGLMQGDGLVEVVNFTGLLRLV